MGVFPALLVLAALFWFRGHAPWELVRTKPLELCRPVVPRLDAGSGRGSGMTWTTLAGTLRLGHVQGPDAAFALFACIGAAGWLADLDPPRPPGDALHSCSFPAGDLDPPDRLAGDLETVLPARCARDEPVGRLGPAGLFRLPVPHTNPKRQRGSKTSPDRQRGNKSRPSSLRVSIVPGRAWRGGRRCRCSPCSRWATWSCATTTSAHADLGRWTRSKFGPAPLLLGPGGVTQVVTYYAQGRYLLFVQDEDDRAIENSFAAAPSISFCCPTTVRPGKTAATCCGTWRGWATGRSRTNGSRKDCGRWWSWPAGRSERGRKGERETTNHTKYTNGDERKMACEYTGGKGK